MMIYVLLIIAVILFCPAIICIGYMWVQSGRIKPELKADCPPFAENTLDKIKFLDKTTKEALSPPMEPPRHDYFNNPIDLMHYDCVQCCKDAGAIQRYMILCPECGNKRCNKASNHRYACTHSNDVLQPEPTQDIYNKRIDGSKIF